MARGKSEHTESLGWAGSLGQLGQHQELDFSLLEILMTGFDRTLDSPV